MNSNSVRLRVFSGPGLTLAAGLLLGLWAYWSTLAEMISKWVNDPQYTFGFLIPLFSVALLAIRCQLLEEVTWQPNTWGIPLIVAGCALRLAGAFFYIDYFDRLSILPSLAGLVVLAGGWQALRWAWPSIAFLIFMLPLPHFVEVALLQPLRNLATGGSTFLLQTLGYPALAQGNKIRIGKAEVDVAQACSGLSMLLVLVALSVAVAMLTERPLLDRLFLLASAVPIAIISNVVRVTLSGMLIEHIPGDFASGFHDSIYAAVLMMVVGLGLLLLEIWLLSRLLVPREEGASTGLFRFGRRRDDETELPAGARKIPAKPKTRVPSPLKLRRRL